ncbi:MAG: D-alanyl-D-alanine carboxypeptidase [Pseudomonadota bacterium]|nr:D-alanyl-D-alanine carboxypeptidase [Pseudomonadota bacterium]
MFHARRIAAALAAVAISFSALTVAAPARAYAQAAATSPKYAAIVVDANSGEVLYASRADSPRYPASITKVMTLYLAFEAMEQGKLRTTDRITVSPRAAAQAPTKLGLAPGETISVEDAIRVIAVRSANDIAVAMAEHLGGTESRFAAMMTLRAQELGMSQTRFVNSNGLPDSRQISSARDIALLSRAVLRDYPQYYSYFSTREFDYRGRHLRNTNGLLHTMPGVDGIKTGFTNASGFNLAASAVRDGRRLIAVVLGGASTATRNNHVQELLNAGFDVVRRRAQGDSHVQMASLLPSKYQASPARYAVVGSVQQGDYTPVEPKARSSSYAANGFPITPAPAAARPRPAPKAVVKREADEDVLTLAKAAVSRAQTGKSTKSESRAKPKADGGWAVQVGAFRNEDDARDRLGQVARKWATHFKKSDGSIAQGGGYHRVRFEGFSREEAQAACQALSAKREPCMALRAG